VRRRPGGGAAARAGLRALGDLAGRLLDPVARRQGFTRAALLGHWPDIVGPQFARETCPLRLSFPPGERNGGTLSVLIEGAAATLFRHVEQEVIDRINGFFGYAAVARLVLRHGAVPSPGDRVAPRGRMLTRAEEGTLDTAVAGIEDPALRSSVARLGRAVIGRR